jgi:hypothetical protein
MPKCFLFVIVFLSVPVHQEGGKGDELLSSLLLDTEEELALELL